MRRGSETMGQSGLWMEEPQEASPGEGGPDCSPRLGCACRLQAAGLPCERRRGERSANGPGSGAEGWNGNGRGPKCAA